MEKKNKYDLATQKGRTDAIKTIEESFMLALINNNFDVCSKAICRINSSSIELGIAATTPNDITKGFKIAFASDIHLYCSNQDNVFGRTENEINFGSSGSFNPSVKESYWRTIHAASILKNWDKATEIINTHCKMYADLEKEIFELNKATI